MICSSLRLSSLEMHTCAHRSLLVCHLSQVYILLLFAVPPGRDVFHLLSRAVFTAGHLPPQPSVLGQAVPEAGLHLPKAKTQGLFKISAGLILI